MFPWFLLLIFYIPFQIALNPGVFYRGLNFDLSSLRVFILLFFCLLTVRHFKKRDFLKLTSLKLQGFCLLGFLVAAGLSLFSAENAWWGARKIVFFISVFPLYFITILLVDDLDKTERVFSVLVRGATILALIGLEQFLLQFVFGLEEVYQFWATTIVPVFSGFNLGATILAYSSWLVNVNGQTIMRAFSLFSDPHIFSFYLGLVLPLALSLFLIQKKKTAFFSKKQAVLYSVSIFTFYIACLLSFARGAYLASILSILLLAGLIWKYLRAKKTALLLCVLLLVFLIPRTPFSHRFYSSFDPNEGSNLGRLTMWQKTADLSLKHVWWGVGLGNYSLALESGLEYYNPVTAHNLYLDLLSEIGIFGLLFWLILIFGTLWQLFRCLKTTGSQETKIVIIGLMGALVYLSVHSFFETGIYHPSLLSTLMVILGASTVVMERSRRTA